MNQEFERRNMRRVIHFKCEICGKESKDDKEILKCEASHYGLSISEKQEWDSLKEECRMAGVKVSITNNDDTQKAFDNAIKRCIQFEKQHNINYD